MFLSKNLKISSLADVLTWQSVLTALSSLECFAEVVLHPSIRSIAAGTQYLPPKISQSMYKIWLRTFSAVRA